MFQAAAPCSRIDISGAASSNSSYIRTLRQLGKSINKNSYSFNHLFGREFMDAYSHHAALTSPSSPRDFSNFIGLQDRYCKDFSCCDLRLDSLHDLLQHFEECHVHVEEDGSDDDDELPFEFETAEDVVMMDMMQSSTTLDQHAAAMALAASIYPSSSHSPFRDSAASTYTFTSHPSAAPSAFDTSIIRKTTPRPKKCKSLPVHELDNQNYPKHSHQSTLDLNNQHYHTIPYLFDPPTLHHSVIDTEMSEAPCSLPDFHDLSNQSLLDSASAFQLTPQQILLSDATSRSSPPPAMYNSPSGDTSMTSGSDSETTPPSTPSHTTSAATASIASSTDRPYKCTIPSCTKSYKNPGGLKYHAQHGHCEDTGDPIMNSIIHKPYQCTVAECEKRYKNLNGLKYHIEHSHADKLLWEKK